jgi:nucleoside-diphosphate-sugar epimerase
VAFGQYVAFLFIFGVLASAMAQVGSLIMHCLITGASGFVGQALCFALAAQGHTVRAACRTYSSKTDAVDSVVVGNIDTSTDWSPALDGIDTVIHLAARVHVMADKAPDPLAEFRKLNVDGALHLARSAVAAGVKRYVFVSSIKINGESTQPGQAFTELDAAKPQDPYAISKHEAELGLRQIAAETGLEVVIIRPPLVYGPGVKANFAALMSAVQNGWLLPLGAIHNQRSLVALDNLVDFIITCATHPLAANQTFLISDGQDMSTTALIRGMAQAAGVNARLLPVPAWALQTVSGLLGKGDAVQRLCGNLQVDISKARRLLGWTPPVTVMDGLKKVYSVNS